MVAVPTTSEPSRNCTVPLAADGAIAAVRVIELPTAGEVLLAESVMVLVAFTLWEIVPVEALYVTSPL
jgi:hypothetical protein